MNKNISCEVDAENKILTTTFTFPKHVMEEVLKTTFFEDYTRAQNLYVKNKFEEFFEKKD